MVLSLILHCQSINIQKWEHFLAHENFRKVSEKQLRTKNLRMLFADFRQKESDKQFLNDTKDMLKSLVKFYIN